jgi:hypothetical protein
MQKCYNMHCGVRLHGRNGVPVKCETKRNEIDQHETKRNNSKWNQTYFNERISWGNTRQKLNEKNRESII